MKKLSLILSMIVMASIDAGQLYTKDGNIQNVDFFIVQSQSTPGGAKGFDAFHSEHPKALYIANLSDGSKKMGAVNSKLYVDVSDSNPAEVNNLKQDFAQLLELLSRNSNPIRDLAIETGFATGQVRGSKEKYVL